MLLLLLTVVVSCISSLAPVVPSYIKLVMEASESSYEVVADLPRICCMTFSAELFTADELLLLFLLLELLKLLLVYLLLFCPYLLKLN